MNDEDIVRAEIYVSGRVQHVGFRRFAKNSADLLGLKGIVKNALDGRVFVVAEGKRALIQLFIRDLWKGPTFAYVENVETRFSEPTWSFGDFSVYR